MSPRSMVRRCILVVGLGLCASSAVAVSPQDYARGRHLQVGGGSALGVYTLPLDVLTVVNGELSQVAVFNARGSVLPYAFRVPEGQESASKTQGLPLFPIFGTGAPNGETSTSVEVTARKDGTLARVYVSAPPNREAVPAQTATRYLVDASALQQPIQELTFVVRPHVGSNADFTWTLQIGAGRSLDDLTDASYAGTLAKLTHQGTSLDVAAIKTAGLRAPYLSITWNGAAPGIIERVDAKLIQAKVAVEPQTTQLLATRMVLNDTAKTALTPSEPRYALVYNAQANLPLQSIQLALSETNTLANIDVHISSQLPKDQATLGELAYSGSVYRLSHNGALFESEPFKVNRSGRYITVTAKQPASEAQLGLNLDAAQTWPRMNVSYAPTQVMFVASGDPPFTLAYGSYEPSHALSPSELLVVHASLNAGQGDADNVSASPAFTLGSPTPPREAWPWKRIGLWTVLILAVGVLVVMTRGLVKRMGL